MDNYGILFEMRKRERVQVKKYFSFDISNCRIIEEVLTFFNLDIFCYKLFLNA